MEMFQLIGFKSITAWSVPPEYSRQTFQIWALSAGDWCCGPCAGCQTSLPSVRLWAIEHAKEEVGSLQGIGVRVEVEDAIEVEDDLEKELRPVTKESLDSVENHGEILKLWDQDAEYLGQQGSWGKHRDD